MQKIGSCGGEQFAPATLINQENPVEEEEEEDIFNNVQVRALCWPWQNRNASERKIYLCVCCSMWGALSC